jgi:hypothetical protein
MSLFNNAIIGASGQQGYQISRSVRLRSSASASLSRTPSGAGSLTTWTWSAWVKRGSLGGNNALFGVSNNSDKIWFSSDQLSFYIGAGAAYTWWSAALFRDPSAWYHIVVVLDTTNATSTDRVRVYVNGVRATANAGSTTYPTQNYSSCNFNTAVSTNIGRADNTNNYYFDGYLTEINFIDGQALTPSSFGETNALTGVWQPKKYGGTYGTNGFYLNFSDNSGVTATTIGKDYSGNGNNWTPSAGISITAGVTYDSMLDVPTPYADGGNGRGNYCVVNPLDNALGASITNGNLQVTSSGASWKTVRSTFALTTGSWYVELTSTTGTGNGNSFIGIVPMGVTLPQPVGEGSATSWGYSSNGNVYNNGSVISATGVTWSAGTTVAMTFDGSTLKFYNAGNLVATISSIPANTYAFGGSFYDNNAGAFNFGQRPFAYTPPTGFVALNTQNLPTPTISNGANYMAATTYTGTGSALSVSNAVNGVSFQPDFVWTKPRSTAVGHTLFDSLRGVTKYLQSNTTGAEGTAATSLTAFNSDGFTVNSDTSTGANGVTYIGWQWNAGGSTVTNTSGSISSQVRANPTAGFSVVTYTGTGVAATIGHGLGVAPSMMIIKSRPTASTSWIVYHSSISPTNLLTLQTTAAQQNLPLYFNSTAPTSSVFSIGSAANTGTDLNVNGSTYVAYCFAAVAGYSAFGKYTGNGSADGPFVYLGFRPRYLLIKSSVVAGGTWVVFDSARSTYNVTGEKLAPNTADSENSGATGIAGGVDFLSNGFKIRLSWGDINTSNTLIYAAFAENPFKLSLAR